MRRIICILILTFLLMNCRTIAQPENPDLVTGVYQAYIDPAVEFIIKKNGTQLMLEIPGQGQANMLPDGENRFRFREVPLVVQFIRKAGEKATGFRLTQNQSRQSAEWIKPSGENPFTMAGQYTLKNDPYKSLYVKETNGLLSGRVNEGPEFLLTDSAGKRWANARDYKVSYEFIEVKGQFTKVVTREGGTLDFLRVSDYEVSLDGGFSRPNGFTRADTLRGTLTTMRACYDVNYYELAIEIFPSLKSITGRNKIRFKAVDSFDRMQIDLFRNMRIEKIIFRGQALPYSREHNAVFVQFPHILEKGIEESITIHYEGKPIIPNITTLKGGFLWYQDREGNPWIESVCQGSGASLWWPCKDHLSDEPDSMKISVTVPDNFVNISNGRLRDTVSLPGKRKRFDWFVSYPINSYNVAVNIGNYKHFSDLLTREKDSMPLHFYCLPYNLEPAKKVFGRSRELLSFLEKSFGEYPFKKDGFTLMESLYPMEHQGAISIGSINDPFWSEKIDYNELTRLMYHEVAHEWWGNSVSAKDIADIWIHEAFATYTEIMAMEYFEGKAAAQQLLRTQVPKNQEPVIGTYGVNDFRLGDVYAKGCMMLHTLRSVIDNDSTWFNLLRGLQREFRYQTVTTDEIVAYINGFLKKDFTPFFEQYLRHAALPELQLKFKQHKDELEIQYRWNTDVSGFNMPVKVTTGKDVYDFIYPLSDWKMLMANGIKRKGFKVDMEGFLVKVAVQ